MLAISLSTNLGEFRSDQAFAAEGISGINFNSSFYSIGDEISLDFDVNVPSNSSYNYKIGVSLSGVMYNYAFSGIAELIEGNLSSGKWRLLVKVPTDAIGDRYSISFKPTGKGPVPKNLKLAANYSVLVNISGKAPPTYPEIKVFNSKIEKSTYTPGENVSLSFETTILSGQINEDIERPSVTFKDVRTGNLVYQIINNKRYKPIVTGSYQTGKWTSSLQLTSNMLSTEILISISTPGKSNLSDVKTELGIITVTSPIQEVLISAVKYDKKMYKKSDQIKVSFQTNSSGFISNDSVKPFLIFTDIERSDLGDVVTPELLSGTVNNGLWKAVVTVPESTKPGDYFLGFYNQAGTIRGLGPVIKVGTEIKCLKGKTTKVILEVNPKCPAGYKKI